MGNFLTKLTTTSVELNESNVSDVIYSQVQKTPATSGQQPRSGLFRSILNYDPRSPSSFITRTPIAMFRNNSASKFVHQELNESIESQVDLNILTPEEQDSLDSNSDLVDAAVVASDDAEMLPDPRSPITELTRTPIIAFDEAKKKKEDNMVKKLADKLIATAISNNDENSTDDKPTIKRLKNQKNLIYEDLEANTDRFSTPPKKAGLKDSASRTPLSCVANTRTPTSRSFIPTSTPKSKTTQHNEESQKSVSRIPVSSTPRRVLH